MRSEVECIPDGVILTELGELFLGLGQKLRFERLFDRLCAWQFCIYLISIARSSLHLLAFVQLSLLQNGLSNHEYRISNDLCCGRVILPG